MDTFSKWLEVVKVTSATSGTTIEKLRSIFATHGIPRILVTDNRPQFLSSEFQAFMKNNGIKHIYSAPYYPATYGLAEWSIQTFKEHMKRLPIGSVEDHLSISFNSLSLMPSVNNLIDDCFPVHLMIPLF